MSRALLVTGCHKELPEAATRPIINAVLNSFLKDWPDLTLIEGEAAGVDTWCKEWAITANIPLEPYKADWYDANGRFRRWAGPERNGRMIKRALAFDHQHCVAFWEGISSGTWNCMAQATTAGISLTVVLFLHPPEADIRILNWTSAADARQYVAGTKPPRRRRSRR